MDLQLQIKMNPALYLRNPESTELGKNIIRYGIQVIFELGFEEFTFRKLAIRIGTTEASIYRYFENKHRLLTYIITWFWTWMEYQLIFYTNNIADPKEKINIFLKLLTFQDTEQYPFEYIDKKILHGIAIAEGNKSYLTKHVASDNQQKLFKPYKDFCHRIAEIFLDYNPKYPFPHSLGSTVIETAHHQTYFNNNLPSLTDFGQEADPNAILSFLHHLVFSALDAQLQTKRK